MPKVYVVTIHWPTRRFYTLDRSYRLMASPDDLEIVINKDGLTIRYDGRSYVPVESWTGYNVNHPDWCKELDQKDFTTYWIT